MTCTHCGAPSTQPGGLCAACATQTTAAVPAWPQPDDIVPSGLVAPPGYDPTITTLKLEQPDHSSSGLPPFGATPAAPVSDDHQFAAPQEAQYEAAPAYVPSHSAAPAPADAVLVPQYGAAFVAADTPVAGQFSPEPAAHFSPAPPPAATSYPAQYVGPAEAPAPLQYPAAPADPYAQHYGTPATYAAPTPQFNAPAPPHYGHYQTPFPGVAAAKPTGNVLSVAAIALAAFAMVAGVFAMLGIFGNPFVAAAGAVVCGAVGLRRGERLAKLGLIFGIVATVFNLGLLILSLLIILL